jgi:hypothetical protein
MGAICGGEICPSLPNCPTASESVSEPDDSDSLSESSNLDGPGSLFKSASLNSFQQNHLLEEFAMFASLITDGDLCPLNRSSHW